MTAYQLIIGYLFTGVTLTIILMVDGHIYCKKLAKYHLLQLKAAIPDPHVHAKSCTIKIYSSNWTYLRAAVFISIFWPLFLISLEGLHPFKPEWPNPFK